MPESSGGNKEKNRVETNVKTDFELYTSPQTDTLSDAAKQAAVITVSVLEALRDGDHEAFKKVYLFYVNPLHRFLTSLTGSFDDAEEIVQGVFLKMWEIRHRIDPSRNIKSYLYTVSRNAALDYLRAKRPAGSLDGVEALNGDATPDSALIGEETRAMVDLAISSMPRKRREVFMLYLKGLSNQEIAERLDITEGNVRQYILRGRSDIRNILGAIAFFLMSGV